MARHESDREDLFAELSALSPRLELLLPGRNLTVCAGKREGWSLYFGPDEVYHFDGQGRLRRAYVDGALYRSAGDTLSRLVRERTPEATELVRHDLSANELDGFQHRQRETLQAFASDLASGTITVLRGVPDDAIGELTDAIRSIVDADGMLAPAVGLRR